MTVTTGSSVVYIPDGKNHQFFFDMYDGLDLVSSHNVKLQGMTCSLDILLHTSINYMSQTFL